MKSKAIDIITVQFDIKSNMTIVAIHDLKTPEMRDRAETDTQEETQRQREQQQTKRARS